MSQGPGVGDQGSASSLAPCALCLAPLPRPWCSGPPAEPWSKVRQACRQAREVRGGSKCTLPSCPGDPSGTDRPRSGGRLLRRHEKGFFSNLLEPPVGMRMGPRLNGVTSSTKSSPHYARDAGARSWRWSCHRATIPRYRGTGPEAYLFGTSRGSRTQDARKDGHIHGRSRWFVHNVG